MMRSSQSVNYCITSLIELRVVIILYSRRQCTQQLHYLFVVLYCTYPCAYYSRLITRYLLEVKCFSFKLLNGFLGLRENMVGVGVGVGVSTSIPGILNGVYFSWSLYSHPEKYTRYTRFSARYRVKYTKRVYFSKVPSSTSTQIQYQDCAEPGKEQGTLGKVYHVSPYSSIRGILFQQYFGGI